MLLKFSAARSKTVVDSFRVSSSSLASATLRDAPVYVNWLPSTGLSLVWVFFVESVSFFSPPVVSSEPLLSGSELPAPVVSPVWFSFSSPPVVPLVWFSFPSPVVVPPDWFSFSSPPVVPLVWFSFPSPVVVPPDWFSFSSPPVVSSGWFLFFSLPVVSSEPEVSSEPLLSESELPAPVFLPPVWSFSVGSVLFSSLPVEDVPLLVPPR